MSAGLEPPRQGFAQGWWTVEGQKMSKSLGKGGRPGWLIRKYGLDQTRYFLLREIAFGSDSDFSHAAMVRRINPALANDYGNLAQRVLSMIAKNCGGTAPEPGSLTNADKALLDSAHALLGRTRACMAEIASHRALEQIWEVCGAANRYIDAQAPWTLRRTDPARMATVLWTLAETLRRLALLTQPYMPDASAKLLDLLATPERDRSFSALGAALPVGAALPAPAGIFPRHVEPEAA